MAEDLKEWLYKVAVGGTVFLAVLWILEKGFNFAFSFGYP